jgi:hypothetical protein
MSDANYLDDEWEQYVIASITKGETHYDVGLREPHEATGRMGFGLSIAECEAVGVVPKVGDALSQCGSFGRPIRGVIINGALVYYRTEAQEAEKHRAWVEEQKAERLRKFEETGRAEMDAKYAALPPIFQARIDKFRHNNPDFRVEYEEYEMFCCEEAVKLAEHLRTPEAMAHYVSLARSETFGADRARWDREWEEQKAIDKAAGIASGHSGNTHGMMVHLAHLYINAPDGVRRMHGALAPLVGSFEYGCVPPDAA